jgi:hypothetical protein
MMSGELKRVLQSMNCTNFLQTHLKQTQKKSQSRSRQQENALRSRELNDIIENKPDTLIFFLPVLKEIPKPIKSGNKIVIITGMKILRDVEQRTSMVSNYCDFHVNLSTFFI